MRSTLTAARSGADTAAQLRELERDLLVNGRPTREAIAAHRERYGLTPKRARRDYLRLRRAWAGLARARDHQTERGRAIARAESLYRQAVAANDLAGAVEAERLRAELVGLFDVPGVKNTTEKKAGVAC